jgi:hypothetical protein
MCVDVVKRLCMYIFENSQGEHNNLFCYFAFNRFQYSKRFNAQNLIQMFEGS